MAWGDNDVYHQPEAFGLTVVGEACDANASYEFCIFAVWQDADGKLYWASDSGCSCPSPFEDYTSLDRLSTGTAEECSTELRAWAVGNEYRAVIGSTFDLQDKLAKLPASKPARFGGVGR